jgi:hypothetical protein
LFPPQHELLGVARGERGSLGSQQVGSGLPNILGQVKGRHRVRVGVNRAKHGQHRVRVGRDVVDPHHGVPRVHGIGVDIRCAGPLEPVEAMIDVGHPRAVRVAGGIGQLSIGLRVLGAEKLGEHPLIAPTQRPGQVPRFVASGAARGGDEAPAALRLLHALRADAPNPLQTGCVDNGPTATEGDLHQVFESLDAATEALNNNT